MKLHIIATRDIVANLYSAPMFVPSIGGAIRAFGDECQREDPKNGLYMHPEHYELWELGTYDDNDGTFDVPHDGSHTQAKQIAVGANYKRRD